MTVLRRKDQEIQNKEDRKGGLGRSWTRRWLTPSKYIKKYNILCIVLKWKKKKWKRVSKNQQTMGCSQQDTNVVRGEHKFLVSSTSQTEHTMTSGLVTPVSSDGTSQVPQNQNQDPAPASDWTLPCLPLGKDTELGSLGLFNRASEKLWIRLALNKLH